MKRFIVNGVTIYEVNYNEKKIINRLIRKDYIVVYDRGIIEHEEKLLLVKRGFSLSSYYIIIKMIYPSAYVVKNFINIGYKLK